MAVARIKLLRNKRQVLAKQMRRDIASLLQKGEDATARIWMLKGVICMQCCSDVSMDCPADLKEGIASLIFATPRRSEIPELVALKNIFEKKYGRDFLVVATDLRTECEQ